VMKRRPVVSAGMRVRFGPDTRRCCRLGAMWTEDNRLVVLAHEDMSITYYTVMVISIMYLRDRISLRLVLVSRLSVAAVF
jgi:hypothetical protein